MMKTHLTLHKSKLQCVMKLRHRQLRRIWLKRRKRMHESGNLLKLKVIEEIWCKLWIESFLFYSLCHVACDLFSTHRRWHERPSYGAMYSYPPVTLLYLYGFVRFVPWIWADAIARIGPPSSSSFSASRDQKSRSFREPRPVQNSWPYFYGRQTQNWSMCLMSVFLYF